MPKMLNKADRPLSCGCCTLYMTCSSGRRWEEREWRREWDDEQRSEDAEFSIREQIAELNVYAADIAENFVRDYGGGKPESGVRFVPTENNRLLAAGLRR